MSNKTYRRWIQETLWYLYTVQAALVVRVVSFISKCKYNVLCNHTVLEGLSILPACFILMHYPRVTPLGHVGRHSSVEVTLPEQKRASHFLETCLVQLMFLPRDRDATRAVLPGIQSLSFFNFLPLILCDFHLSDPNETCCACSFIKLIPWTVF